MLGREESELFILEVDGICLVQTKDLRSGEVNPLPEPGVNLGCKLWCGRQAPALSPTYGVTGPVLSLAGSLSFGGLSCTETGVGRGVVQMRRPDSRCSRGQGSCETWLLSLGFCRVQLKGVSLDCGNNRRQGSLAP